MTLSKRAILKSKLRTDEMKEIADTICDCCVEKAGSAIVDWDRDLFEARKLAKQRRESMKSQSTNTSTKKNQRTANTSASVA
ncbi:MAG: uncharacterized protein KVP18_002127 [Porospora cf. gigantea A]|uniref:uncharacterized protein n=1 Tax=Porospora cf. gigantea A TaxID=2853593 RepID=UPI00355A4D71|nr:MAG: hypothetical protein KVP18_002127 [Porospora cf. gigantea A]